MPAAQPLLDPTGTVPTGDAAAVADAAREILERCFGAGSFDRDLLRSGFALVDRLFAGEHPGYLACDMPYHDLRHSLETALVMARLIAGYRLGEGRADTALTPEHGLLGVLLAVLHDTGYLRKSSESALCGARLTAEHEARSVDFAGQYLRTTALARLAPCASLILATRLSADLDRVFAGHDRPEVTLGQMLGSADLLSQVADRHYLERCYFHLYPELVEGGCDRVRTPDGGEQLLFRDAFDLIVKTPGFYEHVVRRRFDHDFEHVARHLAAHFAGADPYADAIGRNLDRAARMIDAGRPDEPWREPPTTTRDLAPIYRSPPRFAAPVARSSPPHGA
jgi:hypothetical protein